MLAILLTYNCVAIYEYGRVRATLGRFVGHDLVSSMLNPLHELTLGGRAEIATACFCDLRQFSAASEQLSPAEMEVLVNQYTSKVTEITSKFGGRVIDFYGDGVFILFRNIKKAENHALRATPRRVGGHD